MNPEAKTVDIIAQNFENEVLIYDLTVNKAYCLNQTSAIVWQNCDGEKTISEIAEILGKKLKTLPNEDLVWLAIDQLKKDNLMANAIELPTQFSGIKRREVIKKIGLATMIALPIVSSVIAPNAVDAQSGVTCACPSNEPAGCQNGGTYFLGCSYTTNFDCSGAAIASAMNHCCNGLLGNGFNPTSQCCQVFCNP